MRAFSFVHAADLHLGYSQYGLEARREDFDSARERPCAQLAGKKRLFSKARALKSTSENV